MTATITYKCKNCGGGLQFDPAKQKYVCEYCLSEFTQEQLEEIKPDSSADQPGLEDAGKTTTETVLYTCPSCGAQIVTDETTAASFCYYCHNPIILSGKLSGEYNPDFVIPFAVDKKKATLIFTDWMKKKRYVPKSFYTEEQIQKLSGVYFPYLMYSCEADGELEAKADRLRIWVTGNLQYTETATFDIQKKGSMAISHVTRNALKKANRELVEGVLPYDMAGLCPFSPGYLSGFVAERRDMEEKDFSTEVETEVRQFVTDSLRNSVGGYDAVRVQNNNTQLNDAKWEYALLPVWTLTYFDQVKNQMYYFTVNGQTGKVCGRLPVDKLRLLLLFAEIFTPMLILLLLLGYFI